MESEYPLSLRLNPEAHNMRRIVQSDFADETDFIVKELDIPITYYGPQGWLVWFGGVSRAYDPSRLTAANHDKVDFKEWIKVVESSIS